MRGLADSLIIPLGFMRRGSVYYRYYGRCMIQCIGFGYDANLLRKTLSFAVLPIAAAFPESAFTPKGCPFQYSLSCLNKAAVQSASLPEDELHAVTECIVPVLSEADSSEKLYDTLCRLDSKKYGKPDMFDPIKMYACLQGGLYEKAAEIAENILESHREKQRQLSTDETVPPAVIKKLVQKEEEAAEPVLRIIGALKIGSDEVKNLLYENFEVNLRYVKKHLHIELEDLII